MLFHENSEQKIEKLLEKKKSDKIVKFLGEKDPKVVSEALKALGEIGDETSINSVSSYIDSENTEIRQAAIEATGAIGTEYSKTFLQQRLMKEKDEKMKALILDMIHQINEHKG